MLTASKFILIPLKSNKNMYIPLSKIFCQYPLEFLKYSWHRQSTHPDRFVMIAEALLLYFIPIFLSGRPFFLLFPTKSLIFWEAIPFQSTSITSRDCSSWVQVYNVKQTCQVFTGPCRYHPILTLLPSLTNHFCLKIFPSSHFTTDNNVEFLPFSNSHLQWDKSFSS